MDSTKTDEQVLNNYIITALDSLSLSQDDRLYCKLINSFNSSINKKSNLAIRRWFYSYSCCANHFDPNIHSSLLELIYKSINWKDKDAPISEYTNFLNRLIVSNSENLTPILHSLVSNFVFDGINNVHDFISSLLTSYPRTLIILPDCITELFPHHRNNASLLQLYIKNLLWLSEYCNQLVRLIFTSIFDKIIKLDVEIDDEIFQDDNDNSFKLDSILTLLFQYFVLIKNENSTILDTIFHSLLSQLDTILKTKTQPKYFHFVLFFFCNFNNDYVESLINKLIENIFIPENDISIKKTAVYFLASYLVRAVYMRQTTIIKYYFFLVNWVIDNIETKEKSLVYSICEAIFYIFIWYNDVFYDIFLHSPEEMRHIDIFINTHSQLLFNCSHDIVKHYLLTLNRFHVNTKPILSQLLEAPYIESVIFFFPFKEYDLINSSTFIKALYRPFKTFPHISHNNTTTNNKVHDSSYNNNMIYYSSLRSDLSMSLSDLSLNDKTPFFTSLSPSSNNHPSKFTL